MKFEPIIEMPNMVTALWRRFGVHVFEGRLTLDDMTRIELSGNAWHHKNPGKLVELVIIFPSDAKMTGEERTRMARIIKRWESHRNASATVILASGLLGAMHRSVLTGLQMIAPPPHPTKVFGSTPDAVTWLTPHAQALCGTDTRREDLVSAIEQLCTAFRTARQTSTAKPSTASSSGRDAR